MPNEPAIFKDVKDLERVLAATKWVERQFNAHQLVNTPVSSPTDTGMPKAMVEITDPQPGGYPTSGGYYLGKFLTISDIDDLTADPHSFMFDADDFPVVVFELNGGDLEPGVLYDVTVVQFYTEPDGTGALSIAYVDAGGGGGSLDTRNSDNSDQITATTKVIANLADGVEFVASGTENTLKGINAGLAQKGMVTTVNQPVKGYKLSHDDSTTTFTLGSSFGARGNGSTFTATADAGWFTVNETPWVGDSTVGSGLFGIMEDWEFTPIVGGCPANNLGSLFSTPALSVGAAYNTASGLLTAEFYLATTFTSGYPNVALDYNFAGFSLVTDGLNQTLYCGSLVFGPGFSGTRFGVIRGAAGTFTAHDGIDQVVTFTVAGVVHTLTFIGGILTGYTAV